MKRRVVAWSLAGIGALVFVAALTLMIANDTMSRDPTTALSIVMLAGYITVGAIVASRLPSNPIGWLLLSVGLGYLFAGFCAEYTTYTFETNPGALPFGVAAAWVQSWAFIVVVGVPLTLLLFPTGRPPTPRWRWLAVALVVDVAVLTVGAMLRPGPIDVDVAVEPTNPLGVDALEGPISALMWVAGIALVILSVAAILAPILRYRRAVGEERQQLRWLAATAGFTGLTLVLTLLTSIGVRPNEQTFVNDALFLVFFVSLGFGIPLSIAIALLRYRLYDLDLVVKKAVVATLVVLLLSAVAVALLVVLGAILVEPLADSPGATLVAGAIVGVLAWPMLRLARRIADRVVYGGRATPYEVLTEFSDRMADAYSTDDVMPRMARILGEGTGATSVTIWLFVDDGLRPGYTWPDDAGTSDTRDLSGHVVEVRHQGETLGAIAVEMPANDPMNPWKERLIRDLASQAGLVLRNVRLIEELRGSRRRIVAAVDEGRRRLERNIHDGAQQQLVALSVKLRLADAVVDRDPAKAHELLAQLQTDTTDALENLRDLARGIYPPLLADEGLVAALEAQARKVPVPVEFDAAGVVRYGQDVEAAVYFCCLEALQNIAKSSGASVARIRLADSDGRLRFEIEDDGHGFDPATVTRGIGLQGMADRIDAIGGTFEVRSAPGRGTVVAGAVPVQRHPTQPDLMSAAVAGAVNPA